MSLANKVRDQLDRSKPHGKHSDAETYRGQRWLDSSPVVELYSDGSILNHQGELWKYYRLPDGSDLRWATDQDAFESQASVYQAFFKLGGDITVTSTSNTKNDPRRKFHILTVKDPEISKAPAQATPDHAVYLEEIFDKTIRPRYHSYLGVQLFVSNSIYSAKGWKGKAEAFINNISPGDPLDRDLIEFESDKAEVDAILAGCGIHPVNFNEEPRDFYRMFSWHSESDDPDVINTSEAFASRFLEPEEGQSLFTSKWGEIMLHAVSAPLNMSAVDPLKKASRWAAYLLNSTDSDVIVMSIRGELRNPRVSANVLADKRLQKMKRGQADAQDAEGQFDAQANIDLAFIANRAQADAKQGVPMISNLGIVVGAKVPESGELTRVTNSLKRDLQPTGLEARVLVGRQPYALQSCIPGSEVNIGDSLLTKALKNSAMCGVVAFSGLLRRNVVFDDYGFLLGISDDGDVSPVYRDPLSFSKAEGGGPAFLVTGNTGSGKSVTLMSILIQLYYMGIPVMLLNPKRSGSLGPSFKYLNGNVVNMSHSALENDPGSLDPFNFLDSREEIGSLINSLMSRTLKFSQDEGTEWVNKQAKLKTEILDNARHPDATSAYDVLFGNNTTMKPISNEVWLDTIKNKAASDPIWRSIISPEKGKAKKFFDNDLVLVEWDGSMVIPKHGTAESDYTDEELSSLISLELMYTYAHAKMGGRGGAIIVDEAWAIRGSHHAMAMMREGRQAAILSILATQRVSDFTKEMDSDQSSFFSGFMCHGAVEQDVKEIDEIIRVTGFPDTEVNRKYITKAVPRENRVGTNEFGKPIIIPKAFYFDVLNGKRTALHLILPDLELLLARTDADALIDRETYLGTYHQRREESKRLTAKDAMVSIGAMFKNVNNREAKEPVG